MQGERKTALLLLGHGSKVEEANRALYEIAAGVKKYRELPIVEVAFLRLAEPSWRKDWRGAWRREPTRVLINRGEKGGSPLAVSIANALLKLATEELKAQSRYEL